MKKSQSSLQVALIFLSTSLCASASESSPTGGFNAPCRTEVNQEHDFQINASFIYWQPTQDNMQLGVVSNIESPPSLVDGYVVNMGSKFRPGFKVGLGMNFDYDSWESGLEYTWFQAKETANKSLDPFNNYVGLLPSWEIPTSLNPRYSSGASAWNLFMNLLDWDLARGYTLGTKLCFRPFMGMRAAFIKQKLRVDYLTQNPENVSTWPSTHIRQSTDSWGLGPRMGLTMNWDLGRGFRLMGTGEWDILYTQYWVKTSQVAERDASNLYVVNAHSINALRPHANLDVGFGYGAYCMNRKCHFDLIIDYCFQVFFDQNMFRNTVNTYAMGKGIMPNGNLYIQGLTITTRVDF